VDLVDFSDEYDVVIVLDEGVLGVVLEAGAHFSTVLYFTGGMMYQEIMENDEFVALDDVLEEDE
jgi:hypothetical protein